MGRLSNALAVLFGRKATVAPGTVIGGSPFSLLSSQRYARAPRKGSREMLVAYRESPWFHAAVGFLATNLASVRWRLYVAPTARMARSLGALPAGPVRRREWRRAAPELREIETHPLLDLWARPNPVLRSGLAVEKAGYVHREVLGERLGIFERNAAGMPVQYWPVPPTWAQDVPRPGAQSFRFQYGSWNATVEEQHVAWFRDVDAENPYGRGAGLGSALADELATDEYAAQLARARLANGAVPDLVIGVEGAPEGKLREAEERWNRKHGGPGNQGKVHWHSGKLSVEKLSPSFVDLQLQEMRQWERDLVQQVTGIPPELLGIIENSNRATIDSADYLFARRGMVPRLEQERSDRQERLAPEFDERLLIEFDSPVPADRDFIAKLMQQSPAAFRIDEVRELAEHDALPDGRGKLHAVPVGVTFEKDLAAVKPPPPASLFASRGPTPEPRWARAKPKWNSRAWEARTLRAQDTGAAGLLKRIVLPLFRAQRDAAVAALDGTRARAQDDDEYKSVTDASDGAAEEYEARIEDELRKLLAERGADALAELGLEPDAFDVSDPAVERWAREHSMRFIEQLNETTNGKLREVLADELAKGSSLDDQALRLRQTFNAWTGDDGTEVDETRAMRIARTETVAAQNAGVMQGFEQSEIVDGKAWMTLGDGRVRDSHQAIDGQIVGLESRFSNGLLFPGDPSRGDAGERVNCRCTIQPAMKADE